MTPRSAAARLPLRGIVAGSAVFLVPPLVYARAVLPRFGFRDDYALLREAHEEPGKILRVCASQGRLLFGFILELAIRAADDIAGLRGVRGAGVLGLSILAVALLWLAVRAGFSLSVALPLSAALVLTPTAQVMVTWAICSPQVLGLLLGTAAFALTEQALSRARRQVPLLLAAWLALVAGALVYPPNALFYAALIALGLVSRSTEPLAASLRWLAAHLAVVFVGFTSTFAFIQLSFALRWFPRSARVSFETSWGSKLLWFLSEVVPDALANPALDGFRGEGVAAYWPMVAGAIFTLAGGLWVTFRLEGSTGLVRWVLGLLGLPVLAYSVSLMAAERWPSYRSAYAVTAVFTVFLAASLVNLCKVLPGRLKHLAAIELGIFALASALLAHQQTYELFTQPQREELALLEQGVVRAARFPQPTIFVLHANQNDSWAPHRYGDEFGSVTFDAAWLAIVATQVLMRQTLGSDEKRRKYRVASGPALPSGDPPDVVVDMRALRPCCREQ